MRSMTTSLWACVCRTWMPKPARRRGERLRISCALESLEDRKVFSASPVISLSNGILQVTGTSRNDTVSVHVENGQVVVQATNDRGTFEKTFEASKVREIVFRGLAGNDQFTNATSLPCRAYGNNGHDTLTGGNGQDSLDGGPGNDVIHGQAGNDFLRGETGHDDLIGYGGNDTLRGEGGHDSLSGGDGDDVVWGGTGDDLASGDIGSDEIHGGSGKDTLQGGDGYDSIRGGSGHDTVREIRRRYNSNLVSDDIQFCEDRESLEPNEFHPDSVLGLMETDARKVIHEAGLDSIVVERDGQFDIERYVRYFQEPQLMVVLPPVVKLAIDDGRVSHVDLGDTRSPPKWRLDEVMRAAGLGGLI